MRKPRSHARILCANRVGAGTVRLAVAVITRKVVERVVIVDVERQPDGFSVPRDDDGIRIVATEKALFMQSSSKGARILASAYDGDGIGQDEIPLNALTHT